MLLAQWLEQALIVAPLLLLPLILAGVGLVHGLAGLKPDNRTSLVLFYVVLVLFAGPAIMLLVAAATMDSFIDFRKRIGTARP
jgi:hypothetical protein